MQRRSLVAVASLALLGLGIVVGSHLASPRASTTSQVRTVTVPSTTATKPQRTTPSKPTQAAAVAAAAHAITAFNGDVLLRPSKLRKVVGQIAAPAARTKLTGAFEEASTETRAKLAAGTTPTPVIVLRSILVGYRLVRFSPTSAIVAVWYVGIVGSGATVQPQQSWRTEVVSLVWEGGSWKVSSFQTAAGPTPPLSTAEAPATPGQLFDQIPRFEEFSR